MNTLERRYRLVLRLLPRWYRERWEEDMVATFLAATEPQDPDEADFAYEYGRPSWSEMASVAALAVRLRFGAVEAQPRSFAWGEAIRRVGLVVLMVHAAGATVGYAFMAWLHGWLPWLPPASLDHFANLTQSSGWYYWTSLGLGVLPIVAFFALLAGHRRVAVVAAIATVMIQPVLDPVVFGYLPRGLGYWTVLLVDLLLALALLAFHREAPRPRRRPWLTGYAIAVAVTAALDLPAWLSEFQEAWLLDWIAVEAVAVVLAGIACLAGPVLGRRRSPTWPLALALLAGAVLVLRLALVLDVVLEDVPMYSAVRGLPSPVLQIVVQVIALSIVAVALAWAAATALRSLPPSVPAEIREPAAPR